MVSTYPEEFGQETIHEPAFFLELYSRTDADVESL